MAEKKKKITWWRVNMAIKGGFDTLTIEQKGIAFDRAMQYAFQDGEGAEEIEASISDPMARFAFGLLKQGIDESRDSYEASVKAGREGAAKRWENKQNQLIESLADMYGGDESTPNRPTSREEITERLARLKTL